MAIKCSQMSIKNAHRHPSYPLATPRLQAWENVEEKFNWCSPKQSRETKKPDSWRDRKSSWKPWKTKVYQPNMTDSPYSRHHLDTTAEQVEAERKAPGYAGSQGGQMKKSTNKKWWSYHFNQQNGNIISHIYIILCIYIYTYTFIYII